MTDYAIYKIETGELVQIGSCPQFAVEAQNPTDPMLALIEMPDRSWDYWVDVTTSPHTLNEKIPYSITSINKTTIVADGLDTCTITGLHNPTTVTWPDGEVTEVTDGEISFSMDLPGEYTVKLEAIPYFPGEFYVTATNPD